MFYKAFNEFLNFHDTLNMDDNLGKGWGFEDLYKHTSKNKVIMVDFRHNLDWLFDSKWYKEFKISQGIYSFIILIS